MGSRRTQPGSLAVHQGGGRAGQSLCVIAQDQRHCRRSLVTAPESDDCVEAREELAGASQRVGWFRFYFGDHRWEWSDEVQRMHGYEPGTVTPTTELVLAHKHPEDRGEVARTIDAMLQSRCAFSTRHRIIDARDVVRQVVVVGDRLTGNDGAVIGTHGYYVDITPTNDRTREEIITARVAQITESRAVIEQAKGMLMLVYGLDEDSAFDLLRWRSQASNTKVRRLAEHIVANFRDIRDEAITTRGVFDHALLNGDGTAPAAAN
jgi:hypothetical protein